VKQKVVGAFSFISVIGFGVWLYFEPGFEPAIGLVAGIGGLIHTFWPNSETNDFDDSYLREADAIEARWKAEQKLRPASVDDARWILSELLSLLHRVRTLQSTEKYYTEIDSLIYQVKEVQNSEIYLDGGESYGRFWFSGSLAFKELGVLLKKI